MSYLQAKTAKDCDGKLLKVGDWVNTTPHTFFMRNVRIEKMHRQGKDGTIIHTSAAPDPQFPHHMSIRARDVRKSIL